MENWEKKGKKAGKGVREKTKVSRGAGGNVKSQPCEGGGTGFFIEEDREARG